MIVPMKKIFLVVQKKDAPEALDALRDAGIVHVEHSKKPAGSHLDKIKEDIRTAEKVLIALKRDSLKQSPLGKKEWKEKAQQVLVLLMTIEGWKDDMNKRQALISQWEPWGDFDPEDFKKLQSKGLKVKLCEIPKKELGVVPPNIVLKEIFSSGGMARCIAVYQGEVDFPFQTLPLPPMSLGEMKQHQEQERAKIKEAQQKLKRFSQYVDSFKDVVEQLKTELIFRKASAGMGEDENLSFLKGYCPVDECEHLKSTAKKNAWALSIADPDDEDKVPTLLRNPRWVEIIKPLFGMMNILPGYREADISLVFLLFFSVFFGILIGDAGYGAVFFLLTLAAQIKLKDQVSDKAVFFLMYVLSSCAIVWGVLSGTFFGQAWLAQRVQPLLPWLRDNDHVQMLCFLIGAIHLSIAHLWRAVRKAPSPAFIGEIGWLCIIWGMFFAAKKMVLSATFPSYAYSFFIAGVPLILFFSKPNKNPLKAIGPGMGDFFLNIVNSFTDIVSYIRLFAVGLASVAVADAFNEMALEVGFGNIMAGFFAALILLAGHLFNIVLGSMSILVHGLRLNVLEFSGHLNMEWAGEQYQPLRKR